MARTPEKWDVEDGAFWDSTGKSIANHNLWVSIPNLLCGFSVWMYWGMIVASMQRLHFATPERFNHTGSSGKPCNEAGYRALSFTLPAVAGLAGGFLPNAMGLGSKYTSYGYLPGYLAGTALSICILVVLAMAIKKWTSTWVGEGARPVMFTMLEIATKTSAPPAATSRRRRDTATTPSCKSENHDGDEP